MILVFGKYSQGEMKTIHVGIDPDTYDLSLGLQNNNHRLAPLHVYLQMYYGEEKGVRVLQIIKRRIAECESIYDVITYLKEEFAKPEMGSMTYLHALPGEESGGGK